MREDAIFEALAHRQRRQLLVSLRTHSPQRIQELSHESREVAAATDSFIEEFLACSMEIETADKPLIRMHHVHLPKLAADEFIEWDRDANLVTKGPQYDTIVPILEVLEVSMENHSERGPVVVQ